MLVTETTSPRRNALGRYGEDLACRYLGSLGYAVLARNWRCSSGELDIVAVDGECLVACEVKTRSSATFGAPEEAVTPVKLRRIRLLAARWLAEADSLPSPRPAAVRVDVIAIAVPRRGAPDVRHLVGVG